MQITLNAVDCLALVPCPGVSGSFGNKCGADCLLRRFRCFLYAIVGRTRRPLHGDGEAEAAAAAGEEA